MTETTTRRYHHGNLREVLLDRAEKIVRDRGVAELSLRELARDAGVSHGAPRRHFPDRQALLDALAYGGFERLGRELDAAANGRGAYRTRMRRTASAYVRFATQDSALLELMFTGKHQAPTGPLHDVGIRAFESVFSLIAEGQADGHLLGDDPGKPGMLIFATLHGLASLVNGGMLAEDDLDTAVDDALQGLLTGLAPR